MARPYRCARSVSVPSGTVARCTSTLERSDGRHAEDKPGLRSMTSSSRMRARRVKPCVVPAPALNERVSIRGPAWVDRVSLHKGSLDYHRNFDCLTGGELVKLLG
jgi:hypothetical protein